MNYECYEEREKVLKEIGFQTYQEYLLSSLWTKIRLKVITQKNTCLVCGESADHVHHKSYSKRVLEGKDLSQLIPLCSTCHHIIEFTKEGTKTNLKQANRKLRWLSENYLPRSPRTSSPPVRTRNSKGCLQCGYMQEIKSNGYCKWCNKNKVRSRMITKCLICGKEAKRSNFCQACKIQHNINET